MPASAPTLDHPTFKLVKDAFPGKRLRATEFRAQSTLIVEPGDLHAVMAFLKNDPPGGGVQLPLRRRWHRLPELPGQTAGPLRRRLQPRRP